MDRSDAVANDAEATPRHRSWPIILALIAAELVSTFEVSMIYSALAQFHEIYGDSIGIGWLITGFTLVATASAAVLARLGDIFGRKRILLFCLAGAMCGSLVSAMSDSLLGIIVGRSLQGTAGAILPLCYGMTREYFPKARVSMVIGIIAATAQAGGGIGLVLGGLIVDHLTWHFIFVVSAAMALAAFVAVALLVPPSRAFSPAVIDWIGGVLFVPGLWLLLYAIGLGEGSGWGGTEQLSFGAAGAAVLIIWILYERRIPNPIVDVRLLLNRQIGLTILIVVLLAIGTMNQGQIVLVMLQQPVETGIGLGLSATTAALIHMPASFVGVLAGPLCGWYAARRGARDAMIMASACASVAWIGLTLLHDSVWIVSLWQILSLFSIGAVLTAAPTIIVQTVSSDRTSEATGVLQIARKIAMGTGAQLLAISLATSTTPASSSAFPDASAYFFTYAWVAITCVAALLISLRLPKRPEGVRSDLELEAD